MDIILSLAHFCEIHGPTSILSTQAIVEPCTSCPNTSRYTSSTSTTTSVASSPAEERPQPIFPISEGNSKEDSPSAPFFQSDPLNSPLDSALPYFSSSAAYRRKRSTDATSSSGDDQTCASCTFSAPGKSNNESSQSASSTPPSCSPPLISPSTSSHPTQRSPLLRTKTSIAASGSLPSPSNSFTSDSTDSAISFDSHDQSPLSTLPLHLGISRQATNSSSATDSTFESSSTGTPPSSLPSTSFTQPRSPSARGHHKHSATILTSNQPAQPLQYTSLRHSAIRALSLENLPRGSSSGSLLFGTDSSSYTVAYIFRVPDLRARGRRRTYAFLALSTPSISTTTAPQKSGKTRRRTTKNLITSFPLVTSIFSALASRITALADTKISDDRARAAAAEDESLHGSSAGSSSSNLKGMTLTPVSSFLSAKGVDPDGVPCGLGKRRGDAVGEYGAMGRGLAEVTGNDAVFVEVHAGFVRLLVELSRRFGVC